MLSGSEERKVTIHNGKIVTLGRFREQIMRDIEDLVGYMVSPAGGQIRIDRAAESEVAKQRVNSSAVDETRQANPVRGQAFDSQLEAIKSRESSNTSPQTPGGDSSTIDVPMDQVRNVSFQSITEKSATQKSGQAWGTPESHQPTFEDRQHAILGASAPGWHPESALTVADSQHVKPEAYRPVSHESGFQGQRRSFQQFWADRHQPHDAAQPIQHSHQLHTPYHQHTPFGHPGLTPAPAHGTSVYQPPFVPPDKFARAPAPNRVASLYAQTNAWQPTTQARQAPTSGLEHHTEWRNRFGTPAAPIVTPDIAILPYRSGSDDMFPQTSGGASVRYQNLSRNEPPSRAVTLDQMNLPFEETAKLSKPAGWGVMKIGNVSKTE